MEKYKVGQKVWFIELRKATEPKSYNPNGIKVTEHDIIEFQVVKFV
jgi:hypothetical protein